MKKLIVITGIWLITSCSIEPTPINYGNDNCASCRMTIVDQRYGAEIVTKKGKIYNFDAIECMLNFQFNETYDTTDTGMELITGFNQPGQLIMAENSFILRSKNLPSPMGKFLTGFNDQQSARTMQEQNGGSLYSWEELKENFKSLPDINI